MMRVSIGYATLFAVLMVGNVTAQVASPEMDMTCKDSGAVMVTITDPTGAVIPNAFVLFRAERKGSATRPISKEFVLELRTDSTGKQIVSVPCGLVDFFAAADGFAPYAEKMVIEREGTLLSVKLKVYPMVEY